MPFVRFSRDKRGYEHIYLVHAPQGRGHSGPAKVLYWYRTPPGVRVGREPFDDHVRRALEAEYPNLQFDWKRIVNTPIPPPDAENWREKRRLMKEIRVARAESEREARVSDEQDQPALSSASEELPHAASDLLVELVPEENAPSAENVVEAISEGTASPNARPGEEHRHRRRRGGRRRRRGRGPLPPPSLAPAQPDRRMEPASEPASEPQSDSQSVWYSESHSKEPPELNSDAESKAEPDLESEPGDQK